MQKFISSAIYEIRNELMGGRKPYRGGDRRQQQSARGGRGGKRPSTSRERKDKEPRQKSENKDKPATQVHPVVPLPNAQSVAALATMKDMNEKKQFIGNMIYPCIQSVYGDAMVGKITGMLLDEKVVNLDLLVTNQQYLSDYAGQAKKMLEAQ